MSETGLSTMQRIKTFQQKYKEMPLVSPKYAYA